MSNTTEPRFKPGDTVWILWQKRDNKTEVCPFCCGECYVYVTGKNEENIQVPCPKCEGNGELITSSKWKREVERRILDRVQVGIDIPPAYAVGDRWCYDNPEQDVSQIFGTEAEAQAVADKWNAEQKEN
jgi:DnaJ-class molecular chaperone